MKEKLVFIILIVALSLLSIGELMVLSSLSTEVQDLKSQISQLQLQNQTQVSTIVQGTSVQREYLVHDIDYKFSDLDTNTSQVHCKVSIILKETTDDTKVSLSYDNQVIELLREDNQFIFSKDINIFDNDPYMSGTLLVESNGIQKAEGISFDMQVNYYDLLPEILSSGSVGFSESSDQLTCNYNQTWRVSESEATFENIYLIAEVNGKQISKQDVTNEILNSEDGYAFKERVSYPMDKDKDILEVYLMGIDSYGYTHYDNILYRSEKGTKPKYGYGNIIVDPNGRKIDLSND